MGHVVTCRRPSWGQGACVQGFRKLPTQESSLWGLPYSLPPAKVMSPQQEVFPVVGVLLWFSWLLF